MSERLWWFTCPRGHIGLISDDQASNETSIICDQCDFHGSVKAGTLGEEKAP